MNPMLKIIYQYPITIIKSLNQTKMTEGQKCQLIINKKIFQLEVETKIILISLKTNTIITIILITNQ